jgi:hypothetical protein
LLDLVMTRIPYWTKNFLTVLTMLFNIGQINLTLLVFDNISQKPLLSLKQDT